MLIGHKIERRILEDKRKWTISLEGLVTVNVLACWYA